MPIVKQSLLHSFGVHVSRYGVNTSPWVRLVRSLEHHRINVVLDIGANVGQFARDLRHSGFNGQIVSFEPLPSAHADLSRAASGDPKWVVPPPLAISDHCGEIALNVAHSSVASSVLQLRSDFSVDPTFAPTKTISVECSTLDHAFSKYVARNDIAFVKLDVQGHEPAILKGGEQTLKHIAGLQVELSFARYTRARCITWK